MAGKFKIMGYDKGNNTYEQIEEARTKKEALLAAESVMNKYLHTEELQKNMGTSWSKTPRARSSKSSQQNDLKV